MSMKQTSTDQSEDVSVESSFDLERAPNNTAKKVKGKQAVAESSFKRHFEFKEEE